jgi:nicotinamidase-related amidase
VSSEDATSRTPALGEPCVLLIVDVQQGFDDPRWGERNNPGAERQIARLLEVWRETGRPVIHIQHLSKQPDSPLRPGQPGVQIKEEVKPLPGEKVVRKYVNSAFIGTDLESYLRDQGLHTLVVTGLTTDHCVSTTARMAGNLGFETYVVSDATATFDKRDHRGERFPARVLHDTALASLHGEFAEVVEAEELLRRLGSG